MSGAGFSRDIYIGLDLVGSGLSRTMLILLHSGFQEDIVKDTYVSNRHQQDLLTPGLGDSKPKEADGKPTSRTRYMTLLNSWVVQ